MPPSFRVATPADADVALPIYAPYCRTPVSFELGPPSPEEMRQRIVKVLDRHVWLICEQGAEVLGYAYASRHRERAAYRWSVDTTVYVAPGLHRRGIGRGLYESLFAVLALQGYVNAYAGVTLPNPSSVGLHEAVGFVPVGVYRQVGYKNGTWHDVAWYQRPLLPHRPDPPEPRPLGEVMRDEGWGAALAAGLRRLRN
jgi:phosphinothricin acetyltransferase